MYKKPGSVTPCGSPTPTAVACLSRNLAALFLMQQLPVMVTCNHKCGLSILPEPRAGGKDRQQHSLRCRWGQRAACSDARSVCSKGGLLAGPILVLAG